MKNISPKWQSIIERLLPWLVLGILVTFTYAKFVVVPYLGFGFLNGKITEVFTPTPDNSIRVGDQVVWVDQALVADFVENMHLTLFDDLDVGEIVPMVLDREGKIIETEWVVPGPDRIQLLERFNSQWWLPYIFWLAGAVTLLFIRPKDTRWKLLIAFNFLTAIWLSAGAGPSQWHIWKSAVILRSVIWLCLPIYIHFHWEFPSKLRQLPKSFWWLLYASGFVLAISEWFQLLPSSAYFSGFSLALLVSIILLLAHLIFQREYRRDVGVLGLAVGLILLPSLGFALVSLLGINTPAFSAGGSLLAFPALPGAYFFIAYRRQFGELDQRLKRLTSIYLAFVIGGTVIVTLLALADFRGSLSGSTLGTGIVVTLIAGISAITGFSPFLALPALTGETVSLNLGRGDLEIRANRLLSLYLFAIVIGLPFAIGIITIDSLFNFPGDTAIIGVAAAVLGSILTNIGFAPFQRLVDRRILGIQLPPEGLMQSYSDRITTSLDTPNLVHLLRDELLPSLLVRQSVLLRLDEAGVKAFITLGLTDAQIPTEADIPTLLSQVGRMLETIPEMPGSLSWVRLIQPLKVRDKIIGLWLFGRRDPDDFYAQEEISLLGTLTKQTAIALVNIQQAERLHALYLANVERNENERATLARELHDDVLGQLSVLSTQTISTDSPEFQVRYQLVIDHLRQMVSDLRPAMLEYGFSLGLEELVDDLAERFTNDSAISFELPAADFRYDANVEKHLYRIVQQACENAFRHGQAKNIRVFGSLEPEKIHLAIADDGVGFKLEHSDFSHLLAEKHFGLAGMDERAGLIGADLKIVSAPGEGTRVNISWVRGGVN